MRRQCKAQASSTTATPMPQTPSTTGAKSNGAVRPASVIGGLAENAATSPRIESGTGSRPAVAVWKACGEGANRPSRADAAAPIAMRAAKGMRNFTDAPSHIP